MAQGHHLPNKTLHHQLILASLEPMELMHQHQEASLGLTVYLQANSNHIIHTHLNKHHIYNNNSSNMVHITLTDIHIIIIMVATGIITCSKGSMRDINNNNKCIKIIPRRNKCTTTKATKATKATCSISNTLVHITIVIPHMVRQTMLL